MENVFFSIVISPVVGVIVIVLRDMYNDYAKANILA